MGELIMSKDKARTERPLLGGFTAKLVAPGRPGYHRRIVNDDPGRLARVQEAGYAFVEDEVAKDAEGRATNKTFRVGTNADGSPKYGYLMEKPMKWHDDDQARKQRQNDEREAQIFKGRKPELESESEADRFYVKQADLS
jgi:hypothetical protein